MLTFHQILMKLGNDLGYRENNDGVCVLYAEKAIDACLIGEYDVFNKRCIYIANHYLELPALLQRVKDETKASVKPTTFFPPIREEATSDTLRPILSDVRQLIFDVAAFIEQGELYQKPSLYRGVFGRQLSQMQCQEISNYAQSERLAELGGRVCLASFIGVYSREELIHYIKQLNQLARVSKHDFALSLHGDNHRIGLYYSHTEQSWLLIDVNQPLLPRMPTDAFVWLAENILGAFFDSKGGVTAFESKLFTTGQQASMMQEHVNAWGTHHNITSEHATRITERKVTLASLAARAGNAAVLEKIIELGHAATFNQANNNGVTPTHFAACFGQVEALRALMKPKTFDGALVVDFNQASNNGVTAIYLVAEYGHVEALRLLMGLRAPDDKLIVDLKRACNAGVTPVLIAVQHNCVEALRALMEPRTPDGELVVDLNQGSNDGLTPVSIAAECGYVEALRALMEPRTPDGKLVVDLNKRRYDGETPAFSAARMGHVKALLVLMEPRTPDGKCVVDLNQAATSGETPLHAAVKNRRYKTVGILIAAKVNLTCLYNGLTPLAVAEKIGDPIMVTLLTPVPQPLKRKAEEPPEDARSMRFP